MIKAVFWDRDGVINRPVRRLDGKLTAPWSMDEFSIYDDIVGAMELTHEYGYLNFVVTNQPDVTTGKMLQSDLDAIHRYINRLLPVEEIVYCSDRASPDYKPGHGMIEKLKEKYHVGPDRWMVGDRWKDIVAGYNASLTTIYIDRGDEYLSKIQPDYVCSTNIEVAATIIGK